MRRTIPVLAVLALSACTLDPRDEGELYDDELLDESEQALVSNTSAAAGPWLARIYRDARLPTTGYVLRPDLVIGPWISTSYTTSPIRVRWEALGQNSVDRAALYDNTTGAYPQLALYQVDPLPVGSLPGIDTREPAQLVGRALACPGYDVWGRFRRVLVEVTSANQREIAVRSVSSIEYLNAADAGIPCLNTVTNQLVGLVKSTDVNNRRAILTRAADLGTWIRGIENLVAIRSDFRTEGPFAIEYGPDPANSKRMCLDIPSALPDPNVHVQQYPCHYNKNQLFYVDRSVSDPARPRIVSAASGRCIDVPWGSTTAGVQLQQFDCHDGDAQKWVLTNGFGGQLIRPKRNTALCLSVVNGPSFAARPTEQRACWIDPQSRDQIWSLAPR
jgi:hypothetical protein